MPTRAAHVARRSGVCDPAAHADRSGNAPGRSGSPDLSLVSVAQLDQIPSDRGLRVEVDGIAIGLYRVGDAVYAMEDACPHAGVALSKGSLEGCVITCRAHGWPFDVRTGFDPAHEDGFPIPCFAVELRDDEVFVDLAIRVNQRRPARR